MTVSSRKKRIFAGRYESINPLGRGAGGSVYLAEDLHVDRRKVAIKVLTADAYKTVQGKMLRREFEILSKLDHPNLVQVFDFGSLSDGGVFLAEEYIDGFSLQDARALLDPVALIDITFQILLALTYLHGMGWIHRDIKPANVMLLWLDDASARPMVKLVDFGLSSMNPKRDTLRGGTRSYMAPEITRGEKGEFRSDLYSLGVTLYYALCGVLPFGPRSKEDPPPTEESFRPPEPHRLNPAVPLMLSRFTMALLRQLPDFEYFDAGEALQDLVRDTELLEEWSGGVLANSLDVAAAPVIQGYFELGILPDREAMREAVVDRALNQDRPGTSVLQLLVGDAGVGKSRLMRETAAICKLSNRLVVSVDCATVPGASYPSGGAMAMKPGALIHELLERVVDIGTSRNIHQIERYRSYLTILERMSRLGDTEETSRGAEVRIDAQWIREAFEDAVVMLHPQKVVLLIEDIHLADEFSREFFADWYARAQCFHRPDAIATARTNTIEDTVATCEAVELRALQGLQLNDVETFFRERLGLNEVPQHWLEEVARRAEGQPFYLEELCRNLIDRGILRRLSVTDWEVELEAFLHYQLARNVRESFRRRTMAVSALGRECLEILSLAGRPLLWQDLRDMLVAGGATPQTADRALKTLSWRHLLKMRLTMSGRHLGLMDPAIREVLLDMASPKWDRALHRRIGQGLAARWNDGGANALEAATHLRRGGLNDEASTYFEIAGDEAWRKAEYGTALVAFRAAAQLRSEGPHTAVAQIKLARCLLAAYEPDACRVALHIACRIAEHYGIDWLIYSVFRAGISIAISLGDDALAEGILTRLRLSLPSHSHQSEIQEMHAILWARQGRLPCAGGKLTACVAHCREKKNREGLTSALTSLGDILHIRGEKEKAHQAFEEAIEIARDLGQAQYLGRALCHFGAALAREHQGERALEMLTESLEWLSDGQFPDEWIDALLHISVAKLSQGKFEEARRYIGDTRVFARQFNARTVELLTDFILAEMDFTEGKNPDEALDALGGYVDILGELNGDICQHLRVKSRYALHLQRAGRDEAAQVFAEVTKVANDIGMSLWLLAK